VSTVELARVALAELKRRYAAGGEAATPEVLRALREDRREGARELADALSSRARRQREERRRLSGLYALERGLAKRGYARVAGVDEVGMGPLAGPVVAAAVVLPPDAWLPGLDDSKRLSRAARERLAREIGRIAIDFAFGSVEPDEIDRVNIYQAGLLAMRRAVEGLAAPADALVVDARRVPGVACYQEAVAGGDSSVAAIAAASIVAKVDRDARMAELDRHHPGYGFARHAGYGTPEHLEALAALGPSPIHRRSFEPVRACAASAGDACPTS
jgi:ribonuclease HII